MRAPELLQQAELLKTNIIDDKGDVQWEIRLELQRLLENALLADVDYSISKHVEQTLWNSCFKNCIDAYQTKLHRRKKDDEVATLQLFLDSCVGHFALFLGRLCREYDLRLDYYQSDSELGILDDRFKIKKKAEPSSLKYVAQFCLIHLGDIARYQKNLLEAENFYIHAWRTCPENGHALNQLAILETSRGRHLSALALYTRSLYVKNPFAFAAGNIEKFCDSTNATKDQLTSKTYSSFFQLFCDVHRCRKTIDTDNLCQTFYETTMDAYQQGDINANDFHDMLIVIIGEIWKITSTNGNDSDIYSATFDSTKNLSGDSLLTADEAWCLRTLSHVLLSLVAVAIDILLVQIDDSTENKIIAVIKIALDFLLIHPEICSTIVSSSNMPWEIRECAGQFITKLASLLNRLQENPIFIDRKYVELKKECPLPEDKLLQGFLPLEKAQTVLDFNGKWKGDIDEKVYFKTRIGRLISFGTFLSQHLNNSKLFEATLVGTSDKPDQKNWSFTSTFDFEKPIVEAPSNVPVTPSIVTKPTTTKRQTKVVPLITILEREKTPAKIQDTVETQEPQKPTKNIRTDNPDESTKTDKLSTTTAAISQFRGKIPPETTQLRNECIPKFQAARLKQALTGEGKQQQPIGDAPMVPMPSERQFHFGPWSQPAPAIRPSQPPVTLQQNLPPADQDITFHRTPGVRPPGPPPFPPRPLFMSPPPGFPLLPRHRPPMPPPSAWNFRHPTPPLFSEGAYRPWSPQSFENMEQMTNVKDDIWVPSNLNPSMMQRGDIAPINLPFGRSSTSGNETLFQHHGMARFGNPRATMPAQSQFPIGQRFPQPDTQFSLFGNDNLWEYASDRLASQGGKEGT